MKTAVLVTCGLLVVLASGAAHADDGVTYTNEQCVSEWCPTHRRMEACGQPERDCIVEKNDLHASLHCGEILPNDVCKQDTETCEGGNGAQDGAAGQPGQAMAAAAAQAVTNHGHVDPNLQVAAAFDFGQMLGQALVNASNRAAQKKQQQDAIDAAVKVAQEKERKQREELATQHHEQLMGRLKSIDADDTDEDVSMKARGGFDTASADPAPPVRITDLNQRTPLLRGIDADDGGAAGNPIFDCGDLVPKRDRLQRGLPVMRESIRRTQAELDDARDGLSKDHEQMHEHAIENLESAIDLLNEGTESIQEALAHSTPLDPKTQEKLLEVKKELWDIHEDWDKAQDIHELLTDGTLAKARAALLQKDVAKLNAVLADSKAYPLLADTLNAFGGPVSTITFEVGKASIDVAATTWAGHIDARDLEQARQNLAVLQRQESDVEDQLKEVDNKILLAGGCPR